MKLEGWAVHTDGQAHLFCSDINRPLFSSYWAVCGFGADSHHLTKATDAHPKCPICAESLWCRQIDAYGWAAMCGDGDPQFPRITRTISSDRGCAWCGYHPSIPAFEAAQA